MTPALAQWRWASLAQGLSAAAPPSRQLRQQGRAWAPDGPSSPRSRLCWLQLSQVGG
jgi:hypothetical protein